MRRILLSLIPLLSLACSDRAAPTAEGMGPNLAVSANGQGGNGPSRNVYNGAQADAYWSEGDSLSGQWMNGSIFAANMDSLGQDLTTVNWWIQSCDAYYNCQWSGGWGTIPRSTFSTGGVRSAHLVFDPRAYPGQIYIYGDTLGPVDIAWSGSGAWTQSWTGTSEYITPGYRFRTRGTSESTAATATGHAGSWVLSTGTTGSIGTSRNKEMIFYR